MAESMTHQRHTLLMCGFNTAPQPIWVDLPGESQLIVQNIGSATRTMTAGAVGIQFLRTCSGENVA
jgi:hypothetical protein